MENGRVVCSGVPNGRPVRPGMSGALRSARGQVGSRRGEPSVPAARRAGDPALRRHPHVHAGAARHRPRRASMPSSYGIPFDTATSYRTGPRFGPEAIRSASALHPPVQPGARRQRRRGALDRRLRRRARLAGRHRAHVRAGRGGARADRRRGRLRRRARRRPLDHARRAARAREAARPARARAARLARRHLGAVLRPAVLPRHDVQARGRGRAARRARVGAGGHARLALRRRGHRGSRDDLGFTVLTTDELRDARAGGLRRARARQGRRRGRCSSRSTSTSSTRRSRRAPARPRSAASRPRRRSRSSARCAGSSSPAATSSRCRRRTTARAW